MASNHPIDRLFREGTGNLEMVPSAQAWDQIKAKSAQSARHYTWQIAASISLLLISGVIWFSLRSQLKQQDQSVIAGTINAPIPLPHNEIIVAMPLKQSNLIDQNKQQLQLAVTRPTITHEISEESYSIEPLESMTIDFNKNSLAISIDEPSIPVLKFELSPENKINIFYYTHATSDEIDASKGKLGKIIDYARTTTPINWVGDFRNKKDELLDNVFSLD